MRRILLLFILATLLGGCPRRVDFGTIGRVDDPQVVLEAIRHRYERVEGLVGKGRLSVASPEGDGTLQVALEVGQPARVYLESADLLGNPRGVVVTDGERFTFYRPDEDRWYVGSATRSNVGRFLPVSMSPEELAELLLAEFELIEAEQASLRLDDSTGTYVLLLRRGKVQQRLVVATKDLRLISIETRGRRAIDAFLEDHVELLPGVLFPRSIELTLRQQDTRVRLRYGGDLRLNPTSDPSVFVLEPPAGAQVERLP